jgi:hypothetical protein
MLKFKDFGGKIVINWQRRVSVIIINFINEIIISAKKKRIITFELVSHK